MICRSVSRHVSRPVVRNVLAVSGGKSLPAGWLFKLYEPNEYLEVDWDGVITWDTPLTGYSLPAGNSDLFTLCGADWYSDVDTPLVLSSASILELTGINEGTILFNGSKLVIYPADTSSNTLDRAKDYLRIS